MPTIPPALRAPDRSALRAETLAASTEAQRLWAAFERSRPGDPERPAVHAAYKTADARYQAARRAEEDADRAAAGLPPRVPPPEETTRTLHCAPAGKVFRAE